MKCMRVPIGSDSSPCESVWLTVHSPSNPSSLLVGCVYRPPCHSTSCVHSFTDMVDQALTTQEHVCGDLNVNLLDHSHSHSILLINFITSCDDVDDKLDFLNHLFLYILNKHAPLWKVRIKKNGSPWTTEEI